MWTPEWVVPLHQCLHLLAASMNGSAFTLLLFCTMDHPQTADPVLAFGKMAGDTPSTTKAAAHLTKHTWSNEHISQFPSQFHSWCSSIFGVSEEASTYSWNMCIYCKSLVANHWSNKIHKSIIHSPPSICLCWENIRILLRCTAWAITNLPLLLWLLLIDCDSNHKHTSTSLSHDKPLITLRRLQ